MQCPFCKTDDDLVSETRSSGGSIARVRKCKACGRNFKTAERLDDQSLVVRNRAGDIEPFDRHKVATGIRRASRGKLHEHEISPIVERVVSRLHAAVDVAGSPIETSTVGDAVLEELRAISPAAHIRFAIVFLGRLDGGSRGFPGLGEFMSWLRGEYGLPAIKTAHNQPKTVLKISGRVEPFDPAKVRRGIELAVRGRRKNRDDESALAAEITDAALASLGGRPRVKSAEVATAVLAALETAGEEIAYIRFAIVSYELAHPHDILLETTALHQRRQP